MNTMPVEVWSAVTRAAGVCRIVAEHSWPDPARNRLWELEPATVTVRLIVKQHATTTAYQREVAAYQHVTRALGEDRTPDLVTTCEESRTLVLTRIPGSLVSGLRLDADEQLEVFRQAGELLAKLHALAAPVPGPGGVTWQDEVAQVTPLLTTLPIESALMLDKLLAEGPPPLPPITTHGDWLPHNWLWDDDSSRLRIIDFEETGTAPRRRTDFARLGYRILRGHPDLDDSFRHGYGRGFSRAEHQSMRRSAALDALHTLRQGRTHHDNAAVAEAHTMIDHLHADQYESWHTTTRSRA
ncbi:aminoglycoside phosphotransferase family protein [Streptomyces sp. NPDC004111]|uniref:aminoglycoside phosphotransferase family protein n=1 Tax=Streptomyces sp. NPDC004111 TaxID=3364690 RepID=UPI00367918E1